MEKISGFLHKNRMKLEEMKNYIELKIPVQRNAQWWPINALPKLAFDHETILTDAKRVMNIKD